MNNDKAIIKKEDLEVLLNFDLISFIASQETSKEKVDKFIEKFNSLVAMLFLETDLKNAPEDVRKDVEDAMEKESQENIMKLLESKFPDLKVRYMNNLITAKRLIILSTLEYQIDLLEADQRVNDSNNEAKLELLNEMMELVNKDQWREFIKLLK